METKRKTKLEIIEETIEIYSNPDNRAEDSKGACVLLTIDGKKCAVSRCLNISDKVRLEHNHISSVGSLVDDRILTDDNLYPEYRGHPVEFWEDIQTIHDRFNKLSNSDIEEIKDKWVDEINWPKGLEYLKSENN